MIDDDDDDDNDDDDNNNKDDDALGKGTTLCQFFQQTTCIIFKIIFLKP